MKRLLNMSDYIISIILIILYLSALWHIVELAGREKQIEVPVEIVEEVQEYIPDPLDVEYIAKTLYGECRGIPSDMEKAAVAWCILNRLDHGAYGATIQEVVTAPNQFVGYSPNNPVTEELEYLAIDVLKRHHEEKITGEYVGRVLPKEYIYFHGKGGRNYFRKEYRSKEYWDWSLPDTYEGLKSF